MILVALFFLPQSDDFKVRFYHLHGKLNNANIIPQPAATPGATVGGGVDGVSVERPSLTKFFIVDLFNKNLFYTYRDMIHYRSPILPVPSDGPRQQSDID